MLDGLLTADSLPLLAVALGVGVVVGLTGMGGGALMTPALILLGVPPTAAVSNDLVAAVVGKSVGAAVHWKQGTPDLRLVLWLLVGSVPTAFCGGWIVRAIGAPAAQDHFLTMAIGSVLLLTAFAYTARLFLLIRDIAQGHESTDQPTQVRPYATVLIGAAGGLLVGITSVGAGTVIMVALLLLYPTLSAHRLVGTDLLQAVPLVAAAAMSHVLVTGVQWSVLLPLLAGSAPGTYLGARLSRRMSQGPLRRGIVIVLTLTGLTLLGVSTTGILICAAALLILGPLAWAGVRIHLGLPAFRRR